MLKVDKVLHFVACFLICAVTALVLYGVAEWPKALCVLSGVAASLGAGVLKEVFDKYVRKTGFDKSDLMADAIGAGLAGLFTLFM